MKTIVWLLTGLISLNAIAQTQPDTTKTATRILIVPNQAMMHFSDADEDFARFNNKDVGAVRQQLRVDLEANVYHQLLAQFDAISLLRATTMNGEEDLNKIYAATRYQVYSKAAQEEYHATKESALSAKFKQVTSSFARKSKEQTYWVSDSAVMLGAIQNKELFQYLHKKYNHQYLLFITQFEINTSNKNSIEWLKQSYAREYTVHYNLFDHTGTLIRAEVMTIKAGNENKLDQVKSKYLIVLAQKLKDIVQTAKP